jgi:hypothetical protein
VLPVSTVRFDVASTGGRALLDLLPDSGALAWVQDGEGLVGWGEAARLELTGPGRFLEAQAWWDALVGRAVVTDDVRRPGTGLVAFGSFAFDPATGSSVLVVPEVVVGHRGDDWWITTVGRPAPGDRLPAREPVRPPSSVVFSDGALSGVDWMSAVQAAVGRIAAGAVDKVVLARDLTALADEPVDVRWPLRRLERDYPGCWAFASTACSAPRRDAAAAGGRRRDLPRAGRHAAPQRRRQRGQPPRATTWPAPSRTSRSTATACARSSTRSRCTAPTSRSRPRPSCWSCATSCTWRPTCAASWATARPRCSSSRRCTRAPPCAAARPRWRSS